MAPFSASFPALPIDEWEPTKETLHRYLQIVGKIRLALMPRKNHWWYITLYVNSRGICTGPIPYNDFVFEIQLNFIQHQVEIFSSNGNQSSFSLEDGLSVGNFYSNIMKGLSDTGVMVSIKNIPYDLADTIPFDKDSQHNNYQKEYVTRFWQILIQVDQVFKEFSGRSYSKTCPVHLYWHHMDLAVTRFSGEKGPQMSEGSIADLDAYSHEVISFGFWAGDKDVRAPAFYSYTYPSPEGLEQEPLKPAEAIWIENNGTPMALLMYDDIRQKENPKQLLLEFLESSYQAGAKRAGWDAELLRVPELDELKKE
ncbi:DUF5996 family protein [Robertkochia aurantiaca]|uniref:DUF5996 family protein n=1 Tax=Robertkochia aurantiaca TaxID=2873700 RepID=UPI001CCA381B|nr:DUF5996 family protein [Robertkochia sp. 3YJGBD-33]